MMHLKQDIFRQGVPKEHFGISGDSGDQISEMSRIQSDAKKFRSSPRQFCSDFHKHHDHAEPRKKCGRRNISFRVRLDLSPEIASDWSITRNWPISGGRDSVERGLGEVSDSFKVHTNTILTRSDHGKHHVSPGLAAGWHNASPLITRNRSQSGQKTKFTKNASQIIILIFRKSSWRILHKNEILLGSDSFWLSKSWGRHLGTTRLCQP